MRVGRPRRLRTAYVADVAAASTRDADFLLDSVDERERRHLHAGAEHQGVGVREVEGPDCVQEVARDAAYATLSLTSRLTEPSRSC